LGFEPEIIQEPFGRFEDDHERQPPNELPPAICVNLAPRPVVSFWQFDILRALQLSKEQADRRGQALRRSFLAGNALWPAPKPFLRAFLHGHKHAD
jgi:hypothetical protein